MDHLYGLTYLIVWLSQRLGIWRLTRCQAACSCQMQDGLLQCVDGFGAVEQEVEVGGDALPVVGQFGWGGAGGQRAQQGLHEQGVLRGFELALGFEGIAQAHEFFDAGDDAGLFSERRHGYRKRPELSKINTFLRGAFAM